MDIKQRVLDDCSYGLYIVSSHLGGKLNGQISDALMQVTAFPPRVAVSINKSELTHDYISQSRVFAVSILNRTAALRFIGIFGFRSGRDIDKLARVKHKIGETGAPLVLEHTASAFEAKVFKEIDLGTHTLFLGEVVNAELLEEGKILSYRYYTHHLKGKVPKNSPSYHGENPDLEQGGEKAAGKDKPEPEE